MSKVINPCDDPRIVNKLSCYDRGDKKCYGHLIWGCKWSEARKTISLGRCPWLDRVEEYLSKKGVKL